MGADQPVILLTGATGSVGGELLRRLARTSRVIAVTRATANAAPLRESGAAAVLAPGVEGAQWECPTEVRESVTQIIHCAADTRFGLPLEQARSGNVDLTRRLLDLARGCRRLTKFAYVSTIYVAGRTTGSIIEAPNRHANGFCNTYQQAKYEAEQLVLESMSDLPAAIYRLSSIMGDSATGRVGQFNYVHQLIRLLPRNVLPIAPVHPDARVDLICTDWMGGALTHLIERAFAPAQVYQLCGGPEASIPAGELVTLTAELLMASGAVGSIDLPRFVELEEFESYVQSARRRGDRLLNDLLRILGYTLPHLGICQRFENTRCTAGLAGLGLVFPAVRESYARVVDYCIRTDFGRKTVRTATTGTRSACHVR